MELVVSVISMVFSAISAIGIISLFFGNRLWEFFLLREKYDWIIVVDESNPHSETLKAELLSDSVQDYKIRATTWNHKRCEVICITYRNRELVPLEILTVRNSFEAYFSTKQYIKYKRKKEMSNEHNRNQNPDT